MKKILIIIIIALSFVRCSEDFIDRTPTTKKVIASFYETEEDLQQGLVAVYNVLLWPDWDNFNLISEIASDNCFGGGGKTDDDGFSRWDRFQPRLEDNANEGPWKQGYTGVCRANVLLENMDKVDWENDTTMKVQIQAEARFLRAYYYFYMTKMFGEIPLITRTVKPGENFPRAPAEDIYSFIMNDLKYAADNLPDVTYTDSEQGRVTKWAAEAYLGKVFLFYTGYYNQTSVGSVITKQETTNYIDDLINNSGHTLVDTFAMLWRASSYSLGHTYVGEGNPESVFAIKYHLVNLANTEHGGGYWYRMIGPRQTPAPPYGHGWGFGTVNPGLWNAYNAADSRRSATIIDWAGEGLTYDNSDQRQFTGYNWKKNIPRCFTPGQNEAEDAGSNDWQWDNDEDFQDVRFADVLLIGAELHLGDPLAAIYLNRVRRRAYLVTDDSYDIASPTLQDIMNERRLELALEGKRYWDLLRQCGTSFDVLIQAVGNDDPAHSSIDLESFDIDGNRAAEVKGLFQIPPSEIRLMNDIIEQNQGFEN